MKTTQDALELGLYASTCCGLEVIFDEKDVFQRCPKCDRLCEWEMTERVIDWSQFESEAA